LEDEEDIAPLDETDEERAQRLGLRPFAAPASRLPLPKAPGEAPVAAAGKPVEIDDGFLSESPAHPPGDIPVVKDAETKRNAVVTAIASKEKNPKPKWWQYALAGANGFGAGYFNAEGKAKHIDPSAATDAIMGGPQARRRLSDWNQRVNVAQAASDAANKTEADWWKNRSVTADEERKAAQEERDRATAEYQLGRNPQQLKAKELAAKQAQDKDLLSTPDSDILDESERGNVPPGWIVTPSAAQPGKIIVRPPKFVKLPAELAPYALGAKGGDVVPYSTMDAAQKRAGQDTINQNRPVKPPPDNVDRILLDPGNYTPDQVKKAQEMFDKMHRPPVAAQNRDAVADAIERVAQGLAAGDTTQISKIASLRGDQRLLLFDRAKQLNPKFNPAEVDRKIKMEDYYANGKGAANLQSFGTFLEHGGAAVDAAAAVNQGNPKLLNRPINWWKTNMSGDRDFQSFVVALEPVRKEFEGFLLGGRALYGDDRKQAEIILNDSSSMGQIQAALKQMAHTAQARMNEENFRYKKVMGHDLADPISPEAAEGARKMGVALGGQREASPSPSGPKVGDIRHHNGDDYRFDGQQWVKQVKASGGRGGR
jgi:hypothetical protein